MNDDEIIDLAAEIEFICDGIEDTVIPSSITHLKHTIIAHYMTSMHDFLLQRISEIENSSNYEILELSKFKLLF